MSQYARLVPELRPEHDPSRNEPEPLRQKQTKAVQTNPNPLDIVQPHSNIHTSIERTRQQHQHHNQSHEQTRHTKQPEQSDTDTETEPGPTPEQSRTSRATVTKHPLVARVQLLLDSDFLTYLRIWPTIQTCGDFRSREIRNGEIASRSSWKMTLNLTLTSKTSFC